MTAAVDEIDRRLARQNRNPVKVLISGREVRTDVPFEAAGKPRHEKRVERWREYADGPRVPRLDKETVKRWRAA